MDLPSAAFQVQPATVAGKMANEVVTTRSEILILADDSTARGVEAETGLEGGDDKKSSFMDSDGQIDV